MNERPLLLDKPFRTPVGLFVLVRVIADSRADAIKRAKKGRAVLDVAGVTAQSADEWLVELQLKEEQ